MQLNAQKTETLIPNEMAVNPKIKISLLKIVWIMKIS
jgi:hypothetical protein